ncbi:Centrosomal protein of 290 kDa, partial [Exaiptasia diaphana]
MVAIDWNRVLGTDVVNLVQNEEEVDSLVNILDGATIDESEVTDPSKMVKLFEVTQACMRYKRSQVEAMEEELEISVKKEQDFLDEVDILQRELDQYRKHAGSGGDDFMREIQSLSNKNRMLEQDITDKDQALFQEKNKVDKLSTKIEEMERENRSLKREVERSRMDSRDLQRQIEQQRESLALRREGDAMKSTMAKKNKELSEYLDEIKMLQEENETLNDQLTDVRKELEESTMEMNKMTDEYTKLKTVLQQSDLILEDMRRERDALRAQIQDLRIQFSSKSDADDQIMMAVNLKVEEWKNVLATKDAEINQYKVMIADLKQRITGLEMDSDKSSLALMEKEEQIQMLKKEVEKATADMKGVVDQVEEVKAQSEKGVPSAFQQKKIAELGSTLRREQHLAGQERERMLKAEEAARQKDKQLNDLMARMMQYEKGEYGLSDAVQEIKEHKAQIRIRDQNVEYLTGQVNKLSLALNDLEMENEEFRERLGLDPKDKLDIEEIKHKKKVKAEQAAAMNRVLVKEIERLEDERLKLKKQLRKQAMHRGARAVELGITAEDLADVEDEPEQFLFKKKIVIEDSDTEEARTR